VSRRWTPGAVRGRLRRGGARVATEPTPEGDDLRRLRRLALSIGVAVFPVGVAFGVAATEAGLPWWQAAGFSLLVFTGSSQFAAVQVLADGGDALTAVAAALLLAVRSLAYGVVVAPWMSSRSGRLWQSQLMIDESVAVGASATVETNRLRGFVAGGLAVFVSWNVATMAGALAGSAFGDTLVDLGVDAAVPASFLALVWPRLSDPVLRPVVGGGAVVALVLLPVAPPGVPILAAAVAALVGGRPR
jgi:predicted branched-subunit amino acid permease